MKLLTIVFIVLQCSWALSGEYRYDQMATTGLQERVFDKEGKETTIVFSKDSYPKARFLLSKILGLGGISGTPSKTDWRGIPFDQAIFLRGTLNPKILKTKGGEGRPEVEEYQEFILKGVSVRFPMVRIRPGKAFDTSFLEVHFSFETLFPNGLLFEGKKLDLAQHTKKSEQGAARKPSARSAR